MRPDILVVVGGGRGAVENVCGRHLKYGNSGRVTLNTCLGGFLPKPDWKQKGLSAAVQLYFPI